MDKRNIKADMLHLLVARAEGIEQPEAVILIDRAIRLALLCKADDDRGGVTGLDATSGDPECRAEIERQAGVHRLWNAAGDEALVGVWNWTDKFFQILTYGPALEGQIR
jgi:hypothetical protein